MRKILAALITLCLLATGISFAQSAISGIPTGTLTDIGVSSEETSNIINEMYDLNNSTTPDLNFIYFDSLNELLLALNADRIKEVCRIPRCVANYIIARNPDLVILETSPGVSISICLCMALPLGKEELRSRIDDAIDDMRLDGTIIDLQMDYIYNLEPGADPPLVNLPVIDGAETLRVVVTGDLPPLDFVSADGVPAGYNVAFLAEVSKRIGMNIELVTANAGSRALMLSSGKADVIFWLREIVYDFPNQNYTFPEAEGALIFSQPYIKEDFAVVVKAN